jgi:hypothetical protein
MKLPAPTATAVTPSTTARLPTAQTAATPQSDSASLPSCTASTTLPKRHIVDYTFSNFNLKKGFFSLQITGVVFQVDLNSFDSRIDCDDICNSKLDASNQRSWNFSSACRFLLSFD